MANGKTILDVVKHAKKGLAAGGDEEFYFPTHPQRMADEALYTQNAHSAIDNLLIANTLQEIAHTQRGGGMDLLYNIKTKGNEDRYIHSYQPSLGKMEDRDAIREWYANMLRNMVEQNPQFADTLSLKEGKKKLAPHQSIMSRLKQRIGF